MSLKPLKNLADSLQRSPRMPVLFVGHGSPMNAIEDNPFVRSWEKIGEQLPRPQAILVISAHWYIAGTKVLAAPKPRTIYDFYGFPEELYAQSYPAPGAPEFAEATQKLVQDPHIELDHQWGFDHGTWSVLIRMFPKADIPVYQLSIDFRKPPQFHYDLGRQLRSLRDRGVLILGSGNLVHNLRQMNWQMPDTAYDWALEFDQEMAAALEDGNHEPLIQYEKNAQLARLAHPTPDHYYPVLYSLGLTDPAESVTFFNAQTLMGSISMRSWII